MPGSCDVNPLQPNTDMICGTFRMMLRVWGHRPTAVRHTSDDLGVPACIVRHVVALHGPVAGLPSSGGARRDDGRAPLWVH